WALMNGNNGTPNVTDKFLVAAHLDDSGGHNKYTTSGWQTFVDGVSDEQTGGAPDITLNATNTFRYAFPGVNVNKFQADGNASSSTGKLYGSGSANEATLIEPDPGNATPPAIPTLPPYYALAYIQFVGYA